MTALEDWISWLWACFVANRENLLSLATILAGAIGIPLLYIRTRAADRSARAVLEQVKVAAAQAKTAAERHEEQTKADRERRITETFAKAVEQLGLETPLGAIYTLERLSLESEREYWPIMETLTAYVRENAPWPPRQSNGAANQEKEPELSSEPEPSGKRIRLVTDVQAILTVLGRRKKEMCTWKEGDLRLDLSATDLRGADFRRGHFEGVHLAEAHLEDAFLWEVHLERANLWKAHLKNAQLKKAHLEDAFLWEADLDGAYFKEAHLEGAYLGKARLDGTYFREAHLEGAHFEAADLKDAKGLTQEQINSAFGDENTTLPEDLERPAHWTKR